ncbi:MAG: diaminopimelate decarboxylase, partial [Bacteroidota bacterium]|nr:diaminopimelate decarboxylase [Bacteroidota bacterium]
SMSSNYNARYRPAEVLWHQGEAKLIRKAEQFEDLIQNQVVLDLAVVKVS